MIISMTGFGKADGNFNGKKYVIETRSVNSRFLELFFKYPKRFSTRELELKEIVKNKISRGKINITITADHESDDKADLKLDEAAVVKHYDVLKRIRNAIGSREEIKLEHLLNFSDFFEFEDNLEADDEEFAFVSGLLERSLDDLIRMKKKEGRNLEKDMLKRIKFIEKESSEIKKISDSRVASERKKLKEKIKSFLEDKSLIDQGRLEMEIAFLIERIDITEELIRLKSHTKYFSDYTGSDEHAGRRLNFLTQELNREINTIASKSSDAVISQKVAVMKEELEKIREQLQNVE